MPPISRINLVVLSHHGDGAQRDGLLSSTKMQRACDWGGLVCESAETFASKAYECHPRQHFT
jgi:hypothetical protein